ncbi:hypothetical protein BD413DRAFT_218215 [Trametes elegans]|nr:hypothetical protein BD413DRAFT_218215 [Trametes elegans]
MNGSRPVMPPELLPYRHPWRRRLRRAMLVRYQPYHPVVMPPQRTRRTELDRLYAVTGLSTEVRVVCCGSRGMPSTDEPRPISQETKEMIMREFPALFEAARLKLAAADEARRERRRQQRARNKPASKATAISAVGGEPSLQVNNSEASVVAGQPIPDVGASRPGCSS